MPLPRFTLTLAFLTFLATPLVTHTLHAQTAQAAPAKPAEAPSPAAPDDAKSEKADSDEMSTPFFRLRESVITAIHAKDWNTATLAARKFFDFTIPRQNPYEQLEACSLLVELLHHQGRYADALGVIDEMMAISRNTPGGPLTDQLSDLVQRGLLEARMADDPSGQHRYQEQLKSTASLSSALWHWDMETQQIQYLPAGITFPLSKDRWILRNIKEASDRDDPIRIGYWYVTPGGGALRADIKLSYDTEPHGQTPQAQQAWLQEMKTMRLDIAKAELDDDFARQIPALPYKDAVQTQYALKEKSDGRDQLTMYWEALRGNWRLEIRTQFDVAEMTDARAQLPVLAQQIMAWPQAVVLPGGKDFKARCDDILQTGSRLHEWKQAGASAQHELPNAVFPTEVAILQSVIGVAAFQAADIPRARKALDVALDTWPHAQPGDYNSDLYEYALESAAEIAAKAGDDAKAMRLTRQYVDSVGHTYFDWQTQDNALVNRRSRQVLPLRAAGFHIRPIDRSRFYYMDVNTHQVLGLATGLPIVSTDEQQAHLLTQALERQFQLHVLASHASPYQPAALKDAGQPTAGTKWVFDVAPANGGASSQAENAGTESRPVNRPVNRVVFWVVDHGTTRSALRASISDDGQEARAAQLADTLPW